MNILQYVRYVTTVFLWVWHSQQVTFGNVCKYIYIVHNPTHSSQVALLVSATTIAWFQRSCLYGKTAYECNGSKTEEVDTSQISWI